MAESRSTLNRLEDAIQRSVVLVGLGHHGLPQPIAAAGGDETIPAGAVRVVLAEGYDGPGSGQDGTQPSATVDKAAGENPAVAPPPSPVITAGSNDPKCVN